METTYIKTSMGDTNIGFRNNGTRKTLNQSLPLKGFLKLKKKKKKEGESVIPYACLPALIAKGW